MEQKTDDGGPLPPSRGQVRTVLPEQFQGAWFGDVTRRDSAKPRYPIRLIIVSGYIGDRIANPFYPTLNVQATWTLVAAWEDEIHVDERILAGSRGEVLISVMMQRGGRVLHMSAPQVLAILNREN
ncbi:MAG: hypothetical protein ACRDTG_00450 [Pseudonocardiaceae bacterium]